MVETKKNETKIVEIRKELKNMLVVTYRHYASKDLKEKRVAFVNAFNGITLKSNRNGDLYAPITNEVVEKVKDAMYFFASDCVCEVINDLDIASFKMCVSKAYIDAFTQRHDKNADLQDCVRFYELAKMLCFNVWDKAKKLAKSSK